MYSNTTQRRNPPTTSSTESDPSSEFTGKKSSVMDDPCWGGPEQHALSDLLKLLDKSTCILHESDDFVVLNKPPDLRMDGPYPSTVHKLLTYWYPPLSIQNNSSSHHHGWLLETISKLHKHNDLKDNVLRPCHQLDYATSGVLCLARTKPMAATICQAFAQRRVQKVYLALVHGHVDNNMQQELPTIAKAQVDAVFDQKEHAYRRTKANQYSNKKNPTFVGYLPPSAIYLKYKSLQKRNWNEAQSRIEQATSSSAPKKQKYNNNSAQKKTTVLSDDEFESMCNDIATARLSVEQQEELLNKKWSKLSLKEREVFVELAGRYNDLLKKKIDKEKKTSPESEEGLPTLFRVQEESEQERAFYINTELAEVKDDFRVWLHPKRNLSNQSDSSPVTGAADLDYKPSLTRCVVLEHGYLNGQPATKVRLEPKTGRRHQLRLHMVAIQHLIVGDVTYEFAAPNVQNSNACSRMCLHAHSLSMPISSDATTPSSFVAPDPFLVERKGNSSTPEFKVSNCFGNFG